MAHKKGASSSRNGRDSQAQRLGVKRFGGQLVNAGTIIGPTFGLTLDGSATGSSLASIIGTTTGTVTNLSLGYTMLHDKDGEEIIVPNSVMSTNVVILSRARGAKAAAGSRIIQSVERDQTGKGSGSARAG